MSKVAEMMKDLENGAAVKPTKAKSVSLAKRSVAYRDSKGIIYDEQGITAMACLPTLPPEAMEETVSGLIAQRDAINVMIREGRRQVSTWRRENDTHGWTTA